MSEQSLIYRSGGRLHALALGHVIEIMRPLPIDAAGNEAPPIKGISVIRGEATPVIDLGPLTGPDIAVPTRMVSIQAGGRRFALLADEVLGIRTVPADAGEPLGGLDGAAGALDADLHRVLAAIRALPETPDGELQAP